MAGRNCKSAYGSAPTGRRSRWARVGAALLVTASVSNVYGSWGGGREPIMRIGAPCMVLVINSIVPSPGKDSVEKPIFAVENAALRAWPLPASSGSLIPNTRAFESFSAPGATCQRALENICENWIAKKSASGSPSVHRKLTDPGFVANAFSNFDAVTGRMVRHATTAFICSVCNRAFAASFSSSAALTRAFPAFSPASIPSFFASATCPSTVRAPRTMVDFDA